MFATIARSLDLLLLAFTFGATVWFFFVQSPVLLKWMGKEKFLPIQMRLTKSLFRTLAVAVPVMLALAFVHGHDQFWLHVATAGLAAFGALVNHFVIVPRALRAGGRALKDARGGDDERSVTDFASRGGGEASKTWHRLVVVFVVVMLGGMVAHGAALTSSFEGAHVVHEASEHEEPDAHADEHAAHHAAADRAHDHAEQKRWPADDATTRNVEQLHQIVRDAIAADAAPQDVAAEVRAGYQQIFTDCEMTGVAHEQLHEFLLPVGAQIERLERGEHAALAALDSQLGSFDARFR